MLRPIGKRFKDELWVQKVERAQPKDWSTTSRSTYGAYEHEDEDIMHDHIRALEWKVSHKPRASVAVSYDWSPRAGGTPPASVYQAHYGDGSPRLNKLPAVPDASRRPRAHEDGATGEWFTGRAGAGEVQSTYGAHYNADSVSWGYGLARQAAEQRLTKPRQPQGDGAVTSRSDGDMAAAGRHRGRARQLDAGEPWVIRASRSERNPQLHTSKDFFNFNFRRPWYPTGRHVGKSYERRN